MEPDISIVISVRNSKRRRFHWQMAEDMLNETKIKIENYEWNPSINFGVWSCAGSYCQ